MTGLRIIAVDWSGAKTGAAKKIALAEAQDGALLRLDVGNRDRDQIVNHLLQVRSSGRRLVVGLDFGFSFPAWYLRERGFASAAQAWAWLAADGHADSMLRECASPLWGKKGTKRLDRIHSLRRTEQVCPRVGPIGPKSVFQINGPGAVGTGSIRGMAYLHALSEAGFAIWPFDDASECTVVEIYPRLLTGQVNKRNFERRMAHVRQLRIGRGLRAEAASTEDAFDAVVSAITMSNHSDEFCALPHVDDPALRLEGIIWWPGWRPAHGC
jgi:hypothetical protein